MPHPTPWPRERTELDLQAQRQRLKEELAAEAAAETARVRKQLEEVWGESPTPGTASRPIVAFIHFQEPRVGFTLFRPPRAFLPPILPSSFHTIPGILDFCVLGFDCGAFSCEILCIPQLCLKEKDGRESLLFACLFLILSPRCDITLCKPRLLF